MRRTLPLLTAVVVLCAPAGAAAREGRCPDRPGYSVAERSGDVVVTVRKRGDEAAETAVYRACARSVGRDPILTRTEATEAEASTLDRVLVNGRYVAAVTSFGSKYLDVSWSLSVVDVRTGRHLARELSTTGGGLRTSGQYSVDEVVLGPEGHLAWKETDGDALSIRALAGGHVFSVVRAPASAGEIGQLSFAGDVLRWTAGGAAREHRLRPATEDARIVLRGAELGRGRLTARLRGSRRPPIAIAGTRRPWARLRVLRAGTRVAVIEQAFRGDAADEHRVSVFDVLRRRRVAPAVVLPQDVAPGALGDATLAGDGRLVLSFVASSEDTTRTRLVLVRGGAASVLATAAEAADPRFPPAFTALRWEGATVAWLRGGAPGSTPVPPANR